MSLTMYQASIAVFVRGLTALRGLLQKGAGPAAASGSAPNALVAARLEPMMRQLAERLLATARRKQRTQRAQALETQTQQLEQILNQWEKRQ